MRIHKIHLCNIASLQGEHTLNFDQILSEQSLFAITGKTGSGKSTILNAISLALYGKVYKTNSSNNDFITLGESVGSIDLYFSNQSTSYLASWNLKVRKKNGDLLKKPQLTRAFFIKRDGEYIATEKSCEELINLSFDQFCKTSILNQGEFSKFITSSFIERKDILEKFYDGIKLEGLNQRLREKLREKKEEVSQLNSQIDGLAQSVVDITINQAEVDQDLAKLKYKEELAHFAENNVGYIKELLAYIEQYNENTKKSQTLNQLVDSEIESINFVKMNIDERETLFKNHEKELKIKRPILEKCISNQFELRKNQEQIDYLLTEKLDQEELILKNKEIYKKTLDSLVDVQSKIDKIDLKSPAKEITCLEKLKQLSKTLSSLYHKEVVTKQILDSETKNIDEIQTKYNQVQLDIKKLEDLKLDTQIQIIDNKKTTLQKSIEKKRRTLGTYKHKDEQYLDLTKQLKDLQKQAETMRSQYSKLCKDFEVKELEIETSEDALKLYELQKAINLCLDHSIKEKECLVCKAPLESKERLQGTQRKEDRQKTLYLEEKLQNDKAQFVILNNQKLKTEYQTQELSKKEFELKEQIQIIEQFQKENSLFELEKELQALTSELDQNLKKTTELKIARAQLGDLFLEGQKIFEKLQEHKRTKEKHNLELNEILLQIEQEIANLTSLDFIPKNKTHLLSELDEYLEKLEAYRIFQTQLNQFELDKNRLQKDNENISLKIEKIKTSLKTYEANNRELNLFLEEHLDNIDSDAKEFLTRLEHNLKKAQNDLNESKNQKNKIQLQITELSSRNETIKEQLAAIDVQIKTILNSVEKSLLFKHIEDKSLSFITHSMKKILDIDIKLTNTLVILKPIYLKITEIFHDLSQEIISLKEQITQNQTLLEQKTKALEKIKEIKKKLTLQNKDFEKLEKLYELVGKDEFRNFILANIEYSLIQQANIELKNLYDGRFAIAQSHKRNRLLSEFKIIDYYNDAQIRNISTLSGGETFLVSIAMALALAELTRGQTQLDSLFIDEGFGTLDSEAIDEVYDLLVNIQHTGKQLGIISHIQPLTSRFPINIHLNKDSQGKSQTKIVYN